MCNTCGHLWCVPGCPEYIPEEDPGVSGTCENCGRVVFGFGTKLCNECEELLKSEEIVFNSEKHEYMVNGEVVPCVSDIIAVYGKDIDEGDDLELKIDAAAERGTVCHYILAQYIRGFHNVEYPSEYEPYVDAIRLFLSEHKIEPVSIEMPVYCERYGYAGTPDLLCFFDGVLTIVDYKFVSQIAKTKVKAQLNAYCIAYEDNGVYPDQLLAVQFLKNGTYRIYPVKYDDEELEVALKLYAIKNKKHERGKIS